MLLDECARVIKATGSVHAYPRHLLLIRRDLSARARGPLLTPAGVADAYGVTVDQVKGVYWDPRVLAAKVSLVRWSSSADPFCSDMFGAHLHVPLSRSEV